MNCDAARMDLLSECVNIGLGRAAEALNRMCSSHVLLSAPDIRLMNRPRLARVASDRCVSLCETVFLPFSGVMGGVTALAFPEPDAAALVRGLITAMGMDEDSPAMRLDTLREVGNVVLVGVLGAMGTVLGLHVHYQPLFTGTDLGPLLQVAESGDSVTLYVRAHFSLERYQTTGDILVVLAQDGFKALSAALDAKLSQMT